jgi:nicotinamide riboside transporter PnuC
MFFITWALVAIALRGTWLNAKGKRDGFWFWVVSNTGFAIVNFLLSQYAMSALFTAYLFLAIKGLKTWRKNG